MQDTYNFVGGLLLLGSVLVVMAIVIGNYHAKARIRKMRADYQQETDEDKWWDNFHYQANRGKAPYHHDLH